MKVFVLIEGPNWDLRASKDLKCGDVFTSAGCDDSMGDVFEVVCDVFDVANNDGGSAVITSNQLYLTRAQITMLYGPACRAGIPHDAIVAGLTAISEALHV